MNVTDLRCLGDPGGTWAILLVVVETGQLGRRSATRSSPGTAGLLQSSAPCIRGGAALLSLVGRVVSGPPSTTSAAPGGKPALFAPVEIPVQRGEQSAPVCTVAAGTIWG